MTDSPGRKAVTVLGGEGGAARTFRCFFFIGRGGGRTSRTGSGKDDGNAALHYTLFRALTFGIILRGEEIPVQVIVQQ